MANHSGYNSLGPYYDIFIDWEARLAREIPFILEVAGLDHARGAKALDIGCGSGRHLEALHRRGLEAEGMEPSPELRKLAVERLPHTTVHPGGMERLAALAESRGPWDLVLCLGNTLAHLPPGKLPLFAAGLNKALSPGGRAVVHLLPYGRIMRERPSRLPVRERHYEGDLYRFERLYHYQESHIDFEIRVLKNWQLAGADHETLYPHTAGTLRGPLALNGLRIVREFGGFDTSSGFDEQSTDLVAVIGHQGADHS